MAQQINPIVEAAASPRSLRLKVDPAVRENPVAFQRLQFMLATVCKANEIVVREPNGTDYDLELYNSPTEPWNPAPRQTVDFSWATTVEINDRLSQLTEQPVVAFWASKTLEKCWRVAVDFQLEPYHAWALLRELLPDLALSVRINAEPEYNRHLLTIFAPTVVLAGLLERRVREIFSRKLYDI